MKPPVHAGAEMGPMSPAAKIELSARGRSVGFSTPGHEAREARRVPRDLLPLRLLPISGPPVGVSRAVAQRLRRRGARAGRANEVITCLNEIYGYGEPSKAPESAAQLRSQREILSSLAVQPELSGVESSRATGYELLGTCPSYSGEEAPTVVAPYERGRIAMPKPGDRCPNLVDVLDEYGKATLQKFEENLLLDDVERGLAFEHGDAITPYMDTRLRAEPLLYMEFVGDLWAASMIGFTDRIRELVTPFFVFKKDGSLRIVWDCRVSNLHFRKCTKLKMASGARWGELHLKPGEDLFVAQSDVKNFFMPLESQIV